MRPEDRRDVSAARAWWGCGLLTLSCILAFMDRGIISLFVVPIQRDMHLSDTEIGLLAGFAFAVFNAAFGLPVARWVDSGNRRLISSVGVAAWTFASVCCGFAGNFVQLFLARVGIGVGEAALTPVGVSLIADLFPPAKRGVPMGLFYGGMTIGGGLAFILGGLLWAQIGDRSIEVPAVGSFHSWQLILIIIASSGLIVAPLMLTLREPARRDGDSVLSKAGAPLSDVVAYFRKNARTILCHNIGFCMMNFALHAGVAWFPTLLVRTQGWELARTGGVLGAMTLALGPAGAITAGWLSNMLTRRGVVDGKLVLCMCAATMCGICALTVALTTWQPAIIAALGCSLFFAAFSLPLAPGALQDIMPNAMRGQATAVYVGVTNTIAGGFAATSVALLTDYAFGDPMKIGLAYGITGAVSSALAIVCLGFGRAPFRRTIAMLRSATKIETEIPATCHGLDAPSLQTSG